MKQMKQLYKLHAQMSSGQWTFYKFIEDKISLRDFRLSCGNFRTTLKNHKSFGNKEVTGIPPNTEVLGVPALIIL